jgi:HAD superfamily phosphatase (TIGR01668 family)
MKFTFVPDYRFQTFDEASAEFLSSIGVKGLILDVDNTLEPYENATPGDHVIKWLSELSDAGIKCAIVSNNGKERIDKFNENIGLVAYSKAKKPFKKNVLAALGDIGIDPEDAALMGDQVFTDVWAARNAGIKAILVPPIKDKRDIFTRFKRLLEKPIIKKYNKLNRKEK